MVKHPVLYSYRRCPYAMRARMAIVASKVQVEQREIVFWGKPAEMLTASPKGTVPVLILPNGEVIDESRDIMLWALAQSDLLKWLPAETDADFTEMMALIDQCDDEFKAHLDHYKYADRFPERPPEFYREQGEVFLQRLEERLEAGFIKTTQNQGFQEKLAPKLFKNQTGLVDVALFPFIRQFAQVDKTWFDTANYPTLRAWLDSFLSSELFASAMKNRPVWQSGDSPLWVDEPDLQTRDQFTRKARGN